MFDTIEVKSIRYHVIAIDKETREEEAMDWTYNYDEALDWIREYYEEDEEPNWDYEIKEEVLD